MTERGGLLRRIKNDLPTLFLLGVGTVLVFWPVLSVALTLSDFPIHLQTASEITQSGQNLPAYFLFHLLTVLTARLFGLSGLALAAQFLSMANVLLTAAGIYFYLKYHSPEAANKNWRIRLAGMSLALLLAGPVHLFSWANGEIFFGYISPNSYHNPTILMLKPFVVPFFWMIEKQMKKPARLEAMPLAGLIFLTVASTLSKPSFLICLAPALAAWFAIAVVKKSDFNWPTAVIGVAVPGAALLIFQYFRIYGREPGSIIFAPLLVISYRSQHLLGKFMLSLLFPLSVIALYFQDAKKDSALRLSWGICLMGLIYTYLFAESGPRIWHGNMGWSAQITLFVLFLISIRFLLERRDNTALFKLKFFLKKNRNISRQEICWLAFSLHILCGLITYTIFLTEKRYYP